MNESTVLTGNLGPDTNAKEDKGIPTLMKALFRFTLH